MENVVDEMSINLQIISWKTNIIMLRFKHTKIFSMFFLYRKFNSKQFISRKEIQNEIQEKIKYNFISIYFLLF